MYQDTVQLKVEWQQIPEQENKKYKYGEETIII